MNSFFLRLSLIAPNQIVTIPLRFDMCRRLFTIKIFAKHSSEHGTNIPANSFFGINAPLQRYSLKKEGNLTLKRFETQLRNFPSIEDAAENWSFFSNER